VKTDRARIMPSAKTTCGAAVLEIGQSSGKKIRAKAKTGSQETKCKRQKSWPAGAALPSWVPITKLLACLTPGLTREGPQLSGFHTWWAASARSVWEPPRNFTGSPTATRRVQSFVRFRNKAIGKDCFAYDVVGGRDNFIGRSCGASTRPVTL
jgi:hypothetical protein